MKDAICLITFSDNADHQNTVYSMFSALKDKANVYTIGLDKPKSNAALHTERNFYIDGPRRPGITKKTFRLDLLLKIAGLIKKHKIKYLYFESMHIWNAFLMILCPKCKKIVAVHDVIPHDGNKAMDLCNFVTCKMANRIILRNSKYRELLSKKYNLKDKKITCFELWRSYPDYIPVKHSKKMLVFGRIRKYKGFDLLDKIIEHTPEIQYDIVGAPDEETQVIVNKIKKYPNTNVVDKEVSDTDMRHYFENADWVLLPYSSATQSGVVVDAYSMSRPVIAFDVGALSEQIEDKVTGFLIPKKNIELFVNCIKTVTNFTNEETEIYSHRAYDYGYKKYAAKAVAQDFLKCIEHEK